MLEWSRIERRPAATAKSGKEEIQVFTNGSVRNGLVDIGISVWTGGQEHWTRESAVGEASRLNPHLAETGAILEVVNAMHLSNRSPRPNTRNVTIYSDCQAALKVFERPGMQSGQCIVCEVVNNVHYLANKGYQIQLSWIPGHSGIVGNERAYQLAMKATEPGREVVTVVGRHNVQADTAHALERGTEGEARGGM